MRVELSSKEYTLLAELLDQDLREFKEEINKTEAFDYRAALKAREDTLRGLIETLGSAAIP
jgi:hypothetical protein